MKILYPPKTSWVLPQEWFQFRDADRIAVDLETKDPQLRQLGPGVRRDGRIIGVAVAIEHGPAMYLPFGHVEDNFDEDKVFKFLFEEFKLFKGDIVGANLQYDMDYLLEWGLNLDGVHRWRDIQVAEPLIDENQNRYGLDIVAQRYGIPGKDQSLMEEAAAAYGVHPKKEMYKLPARYVGGYAEQDVRLPLELLRRQEVIIEEQKLGDIYDLECRLLPVLLKMRRHGVRIDLARMEEIDLWSQHEEEVALREVRQITGTNIQVGETQKAACMAAPIEAIGLTVPLTPKSGKPSITAEFLDSIEHPIGALLKRARKMASVRTKFINSWKKHVVGDRIHGTFNQLKSEREEGGGIGTVSGRLSSTDPGMQLIPARDPELGPLLRSVFLPDEGMTWASIDYAAQEPRMTIHYAALQALAKAGVMAKAYHDDPNMDNHNMMATAIYGEDFTKQQRGYAKAIFLGLAYGMGGAKLCHQLGFSTRWAVFFKERGRPGVYFETRAQAVKFASQDAGNACEIAGLEGQKIIDEFNRAVPFVKQLAKKVQARASEVGYIRTLLGRRCRFVLREDGRGFDFTHKALNRLIQGSCADFTKKALLDCYDAGHLIQLQVHDELCTSVRDADHAKEIATIMESAHVLKLPMATDIELGESWGSSMS